MSQARRYFLERLQASDPQSIEKFKQSKHKLAEGGQRCRLFDEFPDLLPEQSILELSTSLIQIINTIQPVMTRKGVCEIDNRAARVALTDWLKNIIQTAKHALLNERGTIHSEVRTFLEWNRRFSEKEVRDIVIAYLSAITQAVFAHPPFKSYIEQQVAPMSLLAAVSFINGNQVALVKDAVVMTSTNGFVSRYGLAIGGAMYFSPPYNQYDRESKLDCVNLGCGPAF